MSLRTILMVPPGVPLDTALATDASAIFLDVAGREGDLQDVTEQIEQVHRAGPRPIARVSHPRTRRLHDDVAAAVSAHLYAVAVTAFEPQDIRDTVVALREFELARDIEPGAVRVFPVISTARGLHRVAEIASAAPRVAGLVFDSAAYALDVGARREEAGSRFAFARGRVVAAARAIDGLPVIAGVELQFREMARYGFAAAVVDEASRVSAANDAFAPRPEMLARAESDIKAYETAREQGHWVASRGAEVIDAHRVRKARLLLDR